MEVCNELSCAERKPPLHKTSQRIKQLSLQEFFFRGTVAQDWDLLWVSVSPTLTQFGESGSICTSQLVPIVAICLWKPLCQVKTKLESCDVWCLLTHYVDVVYKSKYLEYISHIRIMPNTIIIGHNQLLDNWQWINRMAYNTQYKLAWGTIRLEPTQIRWFWRWPSRRLARIGGGQTQWQPHKLKQQTLKWELEYNAKQPRKLTKNRQSDSLNKSQLTLSDEVDKGEIVADDDDDGWEPIKLVTGPSDNNSRYWQNLSQNLV